MGITPPEGSFVNMMPTPAHVPQMMNVVPSNVPIPSPSLSQPPSVAITPMSNPNNLNSINNLNNINNINNITHNNSNQNMAQNNPTIMNIPQQPQQQQQQQPPPPPSTPQPQQQQHQPQHQTHGPPTPQPSQIQQQAAQAGNGSNTESGVKSNEFNIKYVFVLKFLMSIHMYFDF